MSRSKIVVGVVGLVLALPAASWAHAKPSVAGVQTHVRTAEKAFDTAVARARKGKDAQAQRFFQAGRAQLALAQAETARMVRGADSEQERVVAAKTVELVADGREEWIAGLPELLAEVEGGFEAKAAAALLADVKGRDAALETLVAMLELGVPEQAQPRLARAAAELAGKRQNEVAAILATLGGDAVGKPAKARLVACLEEIVAGQAEAAKQLAGAADEVSAAQAATILAQAYMEIAEEQQIIAKTITAARGELAPAYRSALAQLAEQAQQTGEHLETTGYPQPSPGQGGSGQGSGSGGEQTGSGEGSGSGGEQTGSGEGSGSNGSPTTESSQPKPGSQPASGSSGTTP